MPELLLHALAVVAAGVGAVCRLLFDGVVSSAVARRAGRGGGLPWGTVAVNLSGSLAIGIVAGGLASAPPVGGTILADSWALATALGLLSGYTTFSTASYQTVRLIQERRWGLAFANGVLQLLAAAGLAALGWWIAALLGG